MVRKRMKAVTAWGGFVEGRLHRTMEHYGMRQLLAIYTSRETAQRCYEDVRCVRITEAKKPRAGGKRRGK